MNLLVNEFTPAKPKHFQARMFKEALPPPPGSGSSSGSVWYHLGNIPNLPPVSLAATSVKKVIDNLEGHKLPSDLAAYPGESYVEYVASWLTGQNFNGYPGKAYDVVSSALSKDGAAPGGVAKNVAQGSWDQSKLGGKKPVINPTTGTASTTTVNYNVSGGGTSATPTGVSAMSATGQYDAFQTLQSTLQAWGLDTPELEQWAWNEISAQGDFKNAAGVVNDLRKTPAYQAAFPGMAIRAANGLPAITEAQYKSIEDSYIASADNYLPKGFLSAQEMGNLIGNGVSATNFNNRIVNGYRIAQQADPNTKNLLRQWYGIDQKHLTAYYLDPKKGFDIMQKQTQAGVIGGIGENVGFGKISQKSAEELAAQAIGSPNSIDASYFRTGFSKEAANVPLEAQQIGQRGQAKVTQQQLLGQAFAGMKQETGTTAAGDAAAVRLAAQARTAGLQGGGGYASSAKGAVGVGRASTAGVQGT